ncbi:hypothetical protein SASPL_149741 [Salvia splendens]|uniref:Uncharacterized protein n=1 Tax=Salvia splendens TaxID=180675 RepID=A0A8X8Z1D6_SALSN|nr:hypothetical protein SASPL_149741 [Salvia splendens]
MVMLRPFNPSIASLIDCSVTNPKPLNLPEIRDEKVKKISVGELACTYAALVLHGDGIPITAEKISILLKAANLYVYWRWAGGVVTVTTPTTGGAAATEEKKKRRKRCNVTTT